MGKITSALKKAAEERMERLERLHASVRMTSLLLKKSASPMLMQVLLLYLIKRP